MKGKLRFSWFGLAILACAGVSFAFPAAFTEWGGVKLTKLVTPAIQVIMFGMRPCQLVEPEGRFSGCVGERVRKERRRLS